MVDYPHAYRLLVSVLWVWMVCCTTAMANPASCGATSGYFEEMTGAFQFRTRDNQTVTLLCLTVEEDIMAEQPQLWGQINNRLVQLLSNQKLTFYFTKDSFGACYAQVVNNKGTWVQAALLTEGLAYVNHRVASDKYLSYMLKNEKQAREAKRGIWQRANQIVKDAKLIKKDTYSNSYNLVRGTLGYTADRGRYIQSCLDDDPWQGLCLYVLRPVYENLRKQGLDLLQAKGLPIQTRGFVYYRDGLKIIIDKAELIQYAKAI
jgi:hypothetical protein